MCLTVSLLILSCLFLLLSVPANAQNLLEPSQMKVERLYAEGTRLLTKGKNFERAILVLREAVQREPKNSDYVLALGCAFASRAYSLSRAFDSFQKYPALLKRDKKAMQIWLAGQQDEKSPVYQAEKPKMTPVPRTDDDGRVFKADAETAQARIKALSVAAWQKLDERVLLRDSDTPERRTDALNLLGWCRILLWLEPRGLVAGAWPEKQSTSAVSVIKPLEEAAALVPKEKRYLRSSGDAYIAIGSSQRGTSPVLRNKGVDILQTVLAETPNDVMLRLFIGVIGGNRFLRPGVTGSTSTVDLMRQVAQSDPSNAYLWYGLFGAAGNAHQYDEAFAALESGNAAPNFTTPQYIYSAHPWTAWAFPPPVPVDPKWQIFKALKYVSTVVFADKNNPTPDTIRYERAVLRVAHHHNKAFGDPNTEEDERKILEGQRYWSSSYAVGMATRIKDKFPETEEDRRLLVEAQNTIKKNDAALAAEDAMDVRFPLR